MAYFYYMGSSHMVCNDRFNSEPDLSSIQILSRRDDILGVSKFDGTSLFGVIVSTLMPI
jgi:hypothetical protein